MSNSASPLTPQESALVKSLVWVWLVTTQFALTAEPTALWSQWSSPEKRMFSIVWGLLQLIAALAVLLSRHTAQAAGVLSALLLVGMAVSRPYFAYNRLFFASVLACAALSVRDARFRPLRWQFVLVFLGAGLDKLFDSDWREGATLQQLAAHFSSVGTLWAPGNVVGNPHRWLGECLTVFEPTQTFWRVVSALVITLELSLAWCLTFRPRWAVGPTVLLMTGIGLFCESTLGMFWYLGWGTLFLTEREPPRKLFLVVLALSGPWFHGWVLHVGSLLLAIAVVAYRGGGRTPFLK